MKHQYPQEAYTYDEEGQRDLFKIIYDRYPTPQELQLKCLEAYDIYHYIHTPRPDGLRNYHDL